MEVGSSTNEGEGRERRRKEERKICDPEVKLHQRRDCETHGDFGSTFETTPQACRTFLLEGNNKSGGPTGLLFISVNRDLTRNAILRSDMRYNNYLINNHVM